MSHIWMLIAEGGGKHLIWLVFKGSRPSKSRAWTGTGIRLPGMALGFTTLCCMTLGKSYGLLYLSRIIVALTSIGGWRQRGHIAKNYRPCGMESFTSAITELLNPSSKSGAVPE